MNCKPTHPWRAIHPGWLKPQPKKPAQALGRMK